MSRTEIIVLIFVAIVLVVLTSAGSFQLGPATESCGKLIRFENGGHLQRPLAVVYNSDGMYIQARADFADDVQPGECAVVRRTKTLLGVPKFHLTGECKCQ